MKVPSRRLIALSGSALMIMGMTVTGAGAASAADNHRNRGEWRPDRGCTVTLTELRRDRVKVEVTTTGRVGRNDAQVVLDFGRRSADVTGTVELRRGSGSANFNIPDRSRGVDVDATIDGRWSDTKCSASLDLDNGRPWWWNNDRNGRWGEGRWGSWND